MDKDNRVPKRRDIYPMLVQITPSWESLNESQLLIRYWEQKNYKVFLVKDNPIANKPRVYKQKSQITFYVCSNSENHRIQLALALMYSCYGYYDKLPGIHSSDEDFYNNLSGKIPDNDAVIAKDLLRKLNQSS